LNAYRFNSVAEASEFADHFGSAALLRPLAHSWAAFLVTDLLVQNQPDEATKPMGDRADRLIVPQAWHQPAIHDLEDASFVLDRSVSGLVENPPHVAVALRGAVVRIYSRALVVARIYAYP